MVFACDHVLFWLIHILMTLHLLIDNQCENELDIPLELTVAEETQLAP